MRLDRVHGDDELVGDLLVRPPAGDQPQRLGLAVGQLGQQQGAAVAGIDAGGVPLHESPGEGREDERLAARDDADGLRQLLRLHALQHEAARAGAQRVVDVLVVLERGHDQHARPLDGVGDDRAGRLDAVHAGHAHVHQHHVGVELAGAADGLHAVRRLAHDLDVRLGLQQRAQTAAHERVVVGDEQADHDRTRGNIARKR